MGGTVIEIYKELRRRETSVEDYPNSHWVVALAEVQLFFFQAVLYSIEGRSGLRVRGLGEQERAVGRLILA